MGNASKETRPGIFRSRGALTSSQKRPQRQCSTRKDLPVVLSAHSSSKETKNAFSDTRSTLSNQTKRESFPRPKAGHKQSLGGKQPTEPASNRDNTLLSAGG